MVEIGGLQESWWISRANKFTATGSKSQQFLCNCGVDNNFGEILTIGLKFVKIETRSTGLREPCLVLVTLQRPVSTIVMRLCNLFQPDRIVSGLKVIHSRTAMDGMVVCNLS